MNNLNKMDEKALKNEETAGNRMEKKTVYGGERL